MATTKEFHHELLQSVFHRITTGYETGTGIGQLMNEGRMKPGHWLVVSALCFRQCFDTVRWTTGRTPEKPMSLVLKSFIREQVDGKPTENQLTQVYTWLSDSVLVLRPTSHKKGHFGDVPQANWLVWKN